MDENLLQWLHSVENLLSYSTQAHWVLAPPRGLYEFHIAIITKEQTFSGFNDINSMMDPEAPKIKV